MLVLSQQAFVEAWIEAGAACGRERGASKCAGSRGISKWCRLWIVWEKLVRRQDLVNRVPLLLRRLEG